MNAVLGFQLFWLSLVIITTARTGVAVSDLVWWSALVGLVLSSAGGYNVIYRMRFRNKKSAGKTEPRALRRAVG